MTEEQATKKKGMGPLAWIAIGCGVLILIAFIVMSAGLWFGGKMLKDVAEDFEEDPARSAAELIVKMNPELELVETDKEEGTITIRVKESGEVATFDYSQIQEGKLGFESSEGTMTFDAEGGDDGFVTMETDEGTATWGAGEKAEWVPDYPNAENLEIAFTQEMGATSTGAFGFSTADSVAEVVAFFSRELESDGFAVQENISSQAGEIQSAVLVARDEASKRHAQVTVAPEGEVTRVSVSYGSGE